MAFFRWTSNLNDSDKELRIKSVQGGNMLQVFLTHLENFQVEVAHRWLTGGRRTDTLIAVLEIRLAETKEVLVWDA